ncbi:MAG: class I SAM-dependent methyltransferase [Planctomycetota bacterium]
MDTHIERSRRRRWLALGGRLLGLWLTGPGRTDELVRRSYNRLAPGYDRAWTNHMRDLSVAMLDRLPVGHGARCLDLTCGTGFITGQLAARSGGEVTGVDRSPGMLAVARRNHPTCRFVESDILEALRRSPPDRYDVVTCGWGLGYSRPLRVLRGVARVLKRGGCYGIIDNSLFSLAEVVWAATLAFAERPGDLAHLMQVRFLPGSCALALLCRMAGLGVTRRWDGSKTYVVDHGQAAIDRLRATGAAAGFEFAASDTAAEQVFARFAQLMTERFGTPEGVPVTHRYLAVTGVKP